VNILSVDRESFERHDIRAESVAPGEQSRQLYSENTTFVVKAQIKTIEFDDNHHLNPGAIIDIRYEVRRTTYIHGEPMVKAGETWTVNVFGSGAPFQGRNWQRPQWSFLVASASAAPAEEPRSTLTVKILSVSREKFVRDDYYRESYKTGERSSGWSETATFVAKAHIETVLNDKTGLSPDDMIEIRYFVFRGSEPGNARTSSELNADETVTLTIFRGKTSFWWRGTPITRS
jgi:hypothetical protein